MNSHRRAFISPLQFRLYGQQVGFAGKFLGQVFTLFGFLLSGDISGGVLHSFNDLVRLLPAKFIFKYFVYVNR